MSSHVVWLAAYNLVQLWVWAERILHDFGLAEYRDVLLEPTALMVVILLSRILFDWIGKSTAFYVVFSTGMILVSCITYLCKCFEEPPPFLNLLEDMAPRGGRQEDSEPLSGEELDQLFREVRTNFFM